MSGRNDMSHIRPISRGNVNGSHNRALEQLGNSLIETFPPITNCHNGQSEPHQNVQHRYYGNGMNGQPIDLESGQHHNRYNGYFLNPPLGQYYNPPNGSLNDMSYRLQDSVQHGQHYDPQNGLLNIAPYEHPNSAQYGQHNNYPYGSNSNLQPEPRHTAPQAVNDLVMRLNTENSQHQFTIEELRRRCDVYRRERDVCRDELNEALQNAEKLASERWGNRVHDADEKAKQMENKAQEMERKAQEMEQKAQEMERKAQETEQNAQETEQNAEETEWKAHEMERKAQDAEYKVWVLKRKIAHLEFRLNQHGETVEVQHDDIQKTPTVKKEIQTPRRGFNDAAEVRPHVYNLGSPANTGPMHRQRRVALNASFVPPPMPGLSGHTGRSTTSAQHGVERLPGDMTWRIEDAPVPLNRNDSSFESSHTALHNLVNHQTLTSLSHQSVALNGQVPVLLFKPPVFHGQNYPLPHLPAMPIPDLMGFGNPTPALANPPAQGYHPNINPTAVVPYRGSELEVQWSQQFDTLFREVERYTAMYTHVSNEDFDKVIPQSFISEFHAFTTDATARKLLNDPVHRHFIVARLINMNLTTEILRTKILKGFSKITDVLMKNAYCRTKSSLPMSVRNAAIDDFANTASNVRGMPGFDPWLYNYVESVSTCFWDLVRELLAPDVNHDNAYRGFRHLYNEAARISLLMACHPLKFSITFPNAVNPTKFQPTVHLNVDPLIHDPPDKLVRAGYLLQLAVSPMVAITNVAAKDEGPKTYHLSRVLLKDKWALLEEEGDEERAIWGLD